MRDPHLPDTAAALRPRLDAGLDALQLPLPDTARTALLGYLVQMHKWNAAYNLSAVRELPLMLSRHLLDSLSVAHLITGGRIVDVGTGADLPGLPLAIAQPHRHFTLVDSAGKRIRFLQHVVRVLNLTNVTVIQSRVQDLPAVAADQIVSRAFTSLVAFAELCEPHLQASGQLLAMKGIPPLDEIDALAGVWQATVHTLQVPELDARRCAVVLSRTDPGAPN